jgi:hypothetical protein
LVHRKCGDSKVAKAVEAARRSYPNIAFTILKESRISIAREAVRLRKHICPSVVYMDKAPAQSSDPQTAVAIAVQPIRLERSQSTHKWVRLDFLIDQSSDSATRADQECAVIVFRQTLDAVLLA